MKVVAIIGGMRRLAVFLLLLALPLQYSWAAVGAYCQHEENAAEWHFGHHVHKHIEDAKGEGPESPGFHADAHHGTPGMPDWASLPQWQPQAAALVAFEPRFALSDISWEPERPKWPTAG